MSVQRITEPSTWAGIGGLLLAIDKIFDVNEAATVGANLVAASNSGAGIYAIGGVLVASLLSIFLPEKGRK